MIYKKLEKQFKYYKQSNYPKHNGLYDCSFIMIVNNDTTKELGIHWWSEIEKFSSRDQISLPYVLNKLGIKPYIITQKEIVKKLYLLNQIKILNQELLKRVLIFLILK